MKTHRSVTALRQREWQHGGDLQGLAATLGCRPEEILDFSANINPLGPPSGIRSSAARALDEVAAYPDPFARDLCEAIGKRHGIDSERIVCGNGSSELFIALLRSLDVARVVIPSPAYIGYRESAATVGVPISVTPATQTFDVDWEALAGELGDADVAFLGHPGNPTGRVLDVTALRRLCVAKPGCWFVVDESFLDFVESGDAMSLIDRQPANVIVVRSMTKFYAIPALRLGYAVGDAVLLEKIRRQLAPWSVNGIAQRAGICALEDSSYARRTRETVAAWRQGLADGLGALGIETSESTANFLLCRLAGGQQDAGWLKRAMLNERIAIRDCEDFDGLDNRVFRVAVRTAPENRVLLDAVGRLFERPLSKPKRITPAIMLQGTASNVGKSLLATGLCRVMLQDGIRVAPFKAQNMALNSFVTADGGEMGRSQVTQAAACGLPPDVRMNPLLLKPMGKAGCQVVLEGKAVATWTADAQNDERARLEESIDACYASLAEEFDAIVLEGAGSPAEVNLKERDLVNMAMARKAQSPVLLVGDIDRGGVFASLIGTMETFDDWERQLVAGFIINRLRGYADGLAPAVDFVEKRCGKPVVGIVPYLDGLHLPEEDSVSFHTGRYTKSAEREDAVDIAVVDLPHISNFTDLDPLIIEPDVNLRTVANARELGMPDAVILPGSKNTVADLYALVDTGLARAVKEHATRGGAVVGLCAGMQMLGSRVLDEEGVEGGTACGLGLLPIETAMCGEKALSQTTAIHQPSGLPVTGYEIHHGRTTPRGRVLETIVTDRGTTIGYAAFDGSVWGTYLHGVFGDDAFRRWFINQLRGRRGLTPVDGPLREYGLEPALNVLADAVREHLDIARVYRMMGL
jgi:adenosylcobyric acid synthase